MVVIEAASHKVVKEGPEGQGEIHGFANPNTTISIFFCSLSYKSTVQACCNTLTGYE